MACVTVVINNARYLNNIVVFLPESTIIWMVSLVPRHCREYTFSINQSDKVRPG